MPSNHVSSTDGVDLVEVHRLQLGRDLLVLLDRAAADADRSASPVESSAAGTGCTCSHCRRLRNCGSSDSMLASAVVPVRGRPLMSTGPQHRELLDLGMVGVPGLDLEPVHESSPEVVDHAGVGRRTRGRRRARSSRAARRDPRGSRRDRSRRGPSPRSRRRAALAARVADAHVSCSGPGRGRSARPPAGSRPASRPRTGR